MERVIEELISPKFSVQCRFKRGVRLGVTNLDWGATSRPLSVVEEAVKGGAWMDYGNPNSCGTITAVTSSKIIEDTRTKVRDHVLHDPWNYSVEFGGEGSTFWLEKFPSLFSPQTHSVICIQRELHNSLVQPWISGGFPIFQPPNSIASYMVWFERRLKWIREIEGKTPIVLLSLSSHVTGGILRAGELEPLFEKTDVIILDATCYLTHEKKIPPMRFDLAVFSGHKLPGGPGSPGVVLYHPKYQNPLGGGTGTRNVLGISKLREAIALRTRLLASNSEKKERDNLRGDLDNILRLTPENKFLETLFPLLWDTDEIYETSRRHPIYSFIIKHGRYTIHPDIIADLMLNIFGFQIRVGAQCSDFSIPGRDIHQFTPEEWLETAAMEDPIMQPSVCRISIPDYLLSPSLVDRLEAAIRTITVFGHYMVKCYTISEGKWNEAPDLTFYMGKIGDDIQKGKRVGCGACSFLENTVETAERSNDAFDVNAILPRLLDFHSGIQSDGNYFRNPYRWFCHPRDKPLDD